MKYFSEFSLFAASFVTVFALGFQQQNVAGRHYMAAIVTSAAIGNGQVQLTAALAWQILGGP